MERIVNDYGTLKRTNTALDTSVQGTAVFPGGAGLWRGEEPFGDLPKLFPEDCLMIVAHNFDKESSYLKSVKRGRELLHGFWERLRAYICAGELVPEQCFFTNALMGLQPTSARGRMDAPHLFRRQCREFMARQIAIVKSRRIAILGDHAREEMTYQDTNVKSAVFFHPSWLTFKKREVRTEIIAAEGEKLKQLWR
jgi:hypothetical protein